MSPSPDVGTLHTKSVPVPVKPPVQAQVTSGPEVVPKQKSKPAPLSTVASDPEQLELFLPGTTGPSFAQPGPSGQVPPVVQTSSLFGDSTVSDAYRAPPEPDSLDIDPPHSEASYSEDQVSDEGAISSDILDRPEQTEDMNYRETVRSIRSFMGWNHIPTFESDLSELGLFPDAVIRTAEQDIASHHSAGSVPRPSPGATQQTGWRSSHTPVSPL